MNVEKLTKLYHNNPEFHAMVQGMYHAIDSLGLTPSELREAAWFTAYMHESETVRRVASLPLELKAEHEHKIARAGRCDSEKLTKGE